MDETEAGAVIEVRFALCSCAALPWVLLRDACNSLQHDTAERSRCLSLLQSIEALLCSDACRCFNETGHGGTGQFYM